MIAKLLKNLIFYIKVKNGILYYWNRIMEQVKLPEFKMYCFSDNDYILEKTSNGEIEYFYCIINGRDCRTAFIKGKVFDKRIFFNRSDFHYDISVSDMEKLESRYV